MFRGESVKSLIEACEIVYLDTKDGLSTDVTHTLTLVIEKIKACTSYSTKRSIERCLEEASQLLKRVQSKRLQELEIKYILPFVRLLITMQLDVLHISTACRKLDQMLLQLAEVNHSLVLDETKACVMSLISTGQILSVKDLQTVCMFLEDNSVGREVCKQACSTLLGKVAEVFDVTLEQEASRNGEWCYLAVKVCLQVFQLLHKEVAPLIWEKSSVDVAVQNILEHLMSIILGKTSNRDTRLLSGTAVAMLINTAPESGRDGGLAAWSLLQVTSAEPWPLCVGGLGVDCRPRVSDGVDRLAVARGLLTCCRKDILTCSLDSNRTCLVLDGLFPVVSALCEENLDCHYYAFQVFTLWLKCLKDCLEEVWLVRGAPLLQEDSGLQQKLTQVIWNNAESPLEGVSEFVHSSFRLLLEIYQLDCQRFGNKEKPLYLALLRRISSLPWEAKAKYFPLLALLPYVGTSTVLEHFPELPCHLLKCFSTNHLSPCASDVYKSLLHQQRRELCGGVGQGAPPSEAELAEEWARRWRPMLLEALTSEVTLLQNSASSCLLPQTLRSFPGAFQALLAPLEPGRPGHLRAWICIMSARRAVSAAWPLEDPQATGTLQLALHSLDDGVRLAALNLLCCTPKTSQPPSLAELAAMRAFIPQNLNSDSSPFRQHLQVGVRRFLVRIRDSCLALLKARKGRGGGGIDQAKEDTGLEEGVGFVDWLAQMPLAYLAPGHSYQRKRTVLLLLAVVLETCTDTWSPDKKKGQPPANISDLISFARQRGQWDFFSTPRLLVLIGCLEDSTNEVRELAAGLLLRFFPRPLPPDLGPALLERATQLLRSPRVQDAQTAALLFRVLLQMSEDASVFLEQEEAVVCADLQCGRAEAVLGLLLQELEQHYLTAKQDMLLAAKTRPIHGVLTALQKCLLDGSDTLGSVQKAVLSLPVADAILDLLERTSCLLLGVLYGDTAASAEEKETPPSFCDMGNAIRSVITQGGAIGEAEGEDCVLLSEEHSLVLTCCWVSLKEIGIFLGSFVESTMATPHFIESPLTTDYLKRAATVFKDILLKCRHWGAVEGCCVGFTKFCAALLSHSDPELQAVPACMLEQGLSVLQSPRATSVTRRAAGLPMLILCVVAAEEAAKSRPLLALAMRTLLETASAPIPQSWDQTLDLPQVCAVHTLQALVRGSGLGVAMLQYASSMTILSLQVLSSPCWAMRNAALQLYSTLCSRMLGQRPGGGEGTPQHGMSPQAFFSHYPALQPFLLGELRQAAGEPGGPLDSPSGGARLFLHPSLFPVLTLLGKLQPGIHDQARCLSAFLAPLLQLAASSIHNVRKMAARALVVMTPPAEYASTLLRLAKGLPEPRGPCGHNRLHGQLQQMRAVLARALDTDRAQLDSGLSVLVECFESKLWLVTSSQRCPLIRSSYLSVCALLARFCSTSFLDQLQAVLLSELQNPSSLKLQLGSASFLQNAVRFLCEEAVRTGDPQWAGQVWWKLSAGGVDVRLSLVRWAADGRSWRGTSLQQEMEKALKENLKAALQDRSAEYRRLYLAALVAVLTPSDPSPPRETPAPLQGDLRECAELLLEALELQEGGPELLSQALCAVSLLLSNSSSVGLFERWSGLLEEHRAPEAPEVLRLACAQALCLAGAPMVSGALRGHSPDINLSPRLLGTALFLLQDEDSRVRAEAALFASAASHAHKGGTEGACFQMQVNQATRCVLDLLLQEFWDSQHTLEALLIHLPPCDLSALLGDVQLSGCVSLYEQDEANVFAEPAVMCELLLPRLLQLAPKLPESPALADRLLRWARENSAVVLENVGLCSRLLHRGGAAAPSWLALAVEPRFHRGLCGLFTRAGLLLKLLDTCEELQPLCCPLWLRTELQQVHQLLCRHGVLLPEAIPANIGLQRSV